MDASMFLPRHFARVTWLLSWERQAKPMGAIRIDGAKGEGFGGLDRLVDLDRARSYFDAVA